mgnify:CR=1 FL=1
MENVILTRLDYCPRCKKRTKQNISDLRQPHAPFNLIGFLIVCLECDKEKNIRIFLEGEGVG